MLIRSDGSLLFLFLVFIGPSVKTTTATLNCLLARQFCFEDSSCSAILEIIPRVCGPELVACSTVTVTKCQAALRTLQAFPFFKPTCLCRPPQVDPECNTFRDFLFDHPCVFVMKKEKDPYPVDALPTCNHALSVCQQERKCIKLYEDFKANCKVRDNKCRMEDRDSCHEAWTNLRRSPMFGCICPNNHMKKRCDRIFSMVNHNPCVDTFPAPTSHAQNPLEPRSRYLDMFRKTGVTPSVRYPHLPDPSHGTAMDTYRTHHNYDGTGTGTDSNSPEIGSLNTLGLPELYEKATDNSSTSFDYGLGNAIVENPLVDADNGYDAHHDNDHINVSVLKNKGKTTAVNFSHYPEEEGSNVGPSNYHQKYPSSSDIGRSENEVSRMIFQSTCHLAMDSCNNNYHCRMSLSPILHHCDMSRCNRNSCMEALQAFYRKPSLPWNMEIAFCLCKKTNNKHDACLIAQEKLHPVCAQRIEGSPQPTCLSLAEVCRDSKECRARLEQYEQSCAVDSVTKKCAGSPSDCRSAMLGILGTDLRTTCACKGTDMTQIYECLGWQRLLWVNPCVVESQKDFHMLKAAELAKYTTTQASTRAIPPRVVATKSPMPIFVTVMSATEASLHTRENTMPELIPPPQPFIPTSTTTSTSTSTTTQRPTTTTVKTTTVPPRYCVVQRPQFPDQYIKEGSFKRIYHEDEFECSDICECEVSEKLSCKTICIDRMPCKTEFAFYNHAAPAYQAFRGRCLCYSGRFICIKPSPGDYNLPQGVYLFLGYSEADEKELNKNQTRVMVQDIVRILQNFIKEEAVNGTLCSLELFNITRENVIIMGKLSDEVDYNTLSPAESFQKEKEQCTELLEIISDRINSRNPDFISHLLLSIFKMAEVEIIQIEQSSTAVSFSSKFNVVVATVILTTVFRLHMSAS
ncbi:uncharacterized protein LOC123321927 isoform X1 [Coccinella septempunctata]|uniref:uncharacterized protein LOC123321927 isoform X1 n=1 Tax=Coccinella septempunctata TaxID=41139 RepID=UPI001D0668B6|nr:uncharacterized protein LOC123321927 isoform X1 [Coccinella septempunctata]